MPTQEATILYGRISGLAEIIAGDKDGQSSHLLQEFFEQTEAAIRMHNGLVLGFSGESFSAVFQDGQAQQNGIEAAMECKVRLNRLQEKHKLLSDVTFKSGIAHATVVKYDLQKNDNIPDKIMGEGVDLAERLFQINPDVRVILCTGNSDFESFSGSGHKWLKGVIRKPVIMKEMAETIRQVLDR